MKKLIIGLFIFSLFILGSSFKAEASLPSITILSPNGGETIQVGQKYNIRWDSTGISDNSDINISLKYYDMACGYTSMVGCQSSFYIDTVKNTGSYLWDTSKKMSGASTGPNSVSVVSGTRYVIELLSSSGIKDESDNYFTATSTISNNPVISGVSGPQTLNVNQVGTWGIIASNPTGGNLSYSVVWGDEPFYQTLNTSTIPTVNGYQQSATFTHSYSRSGTFTPIFTVISANTINCFTTPCPSNAGSAQTTLSVNVGNSNPIEIQGCLPGFKFSTITGLPCSTELVNDGCAAGYNFSPITGQVCNTQYKNICTEPGSNCGIINHRIFRTLRRGTQGDDVKRLQTFLGINADGSFGRETAAKVKEWQTLNGVRADGVFGSESRHQAGLDN